MEFEASQEAVSLKDSMDQGKTRLFSAKMNVHFNEHLILCSLIVHAWEEKAMVKTRLIEDKSKVVHNLKIA